MPIAAIYARFSTDNQKDTSIDDQVRRCKILAKTSGYTVPDSMIFSDAAISGNAKSTSKREGYRDLLAAWDAGQFECVILDEISRISRSVKEIITINEKVTRTGIRLLTVDGKDSLALNWRMWVELGAVFAEQSLRDTAFRVKRGMRGQLDRGFDVNSPPYGYSTVSVGADGQPVAIIDAKVGMKWVIDPEKAEVVRLMYELRRAGKSYNQICADLNQKQVQPPRAPRTEDAIAFWRPATVQRLLANPIFRGVFVAVDTELVESDQSSRNHSRNVLYHRPDLKIVDDDVWFACNQQVEGRAPYGGVKNALSGLITCGCCGAKLSLSGKGKKGKFVQSFYCASCAQRRTVGHTEKNIGVGHTALHGVDAMLKFVLSRVASDPEIREGFKDRLHAKLSGNRQDEIDRMKRECDQAEKAYSRALKLLDTIGDEELLAKRIASLYHAWKAREMQYNQVRSDGEQVDRVTIAKQLEFDLSEAIARIFDTRLPPERLRAVLARVFPRIEALGKPSRFVSLFDVSTCPGAVVAASTDSDIQDNGLFTMRLRLSTSADNNEGWHVEEITESRKDSRKERIA